MYNENLLGNYMRLIDIKDHNNKDNLKSVKLRERAAAAVNKMMNTLGFKHVLGKSKIDKDTSIENWARL